MIWPVGVGFTSRGPTGAAGIDNNDGQTFARKIHGDFLRQPFRIFVMIGQLRHGDLCKFVRRSGHAPDGGRQPNAPDGACVNNALATGFAGGFDDVARALDVCGVHRFVIAQPQMIARRGVKTPMTAFDFTFQQFTVTHVARHTLELQTSESAQITVRVATTPSPDARAREVREQDSSQ